MFTFKALNFIIQNFCIKQFPLPLPSQKTAFISMFCAEVLSSSEFNIMPVQLSGWPSIDSV